MKSRWDEIKAKMAKNQNNNFASVRSHTNLEEGKHHSARMWCIFCFTILSEVYYMVSGNILRIFWGWDLITWEPCGTDCMSVVCRLDEGKRFQAMRPVPTGCLALNYICWINWILKTYLHSVRCNSTILISVWRPYAHNSTLLTLSIANTSNKNKGNGHFLVTFRVDISSPFCLIWNAEI